MTAIVAARKHALIGIILAAAAAIMLMMASGRARAVAAQSFCPTPAAIPGGYDYPQAPGTIEHWVDTGDVARGRVHGWAVWAALNQPAGGGKAVWQSWCTETQAFASSQALAAAPGRTPGARPMRAFKFDNGLRTGEDPINFPEHPIYPIPTPLYANAKRAGCVVPAQSKGDIQSLANGAAYQNNGDVMVAGVIYNKPAFDWIRSRQLYLQSTLQRMVPPWDETRQMAAMPAGSIVLKPMMWPVPASGFSALPIWDDLKDDGDRYAGFEIKQKWSRAVAITAAPGTRPAPERLSFLHGVTMGGRALGPVTFDRPPVVGIDQFYHYRPDVASLSACDRMILNASSFYAYNRPFLQGDYLVLVAMHVMTKEQPAWTFQSVWWHDRPDAGVYAADRPSLPNAQGPWAHYLMTSTYGIPGAPGQWPVAYNPYIELAADHPIETNCMNCHHRAAWPATPDEYKAKHGPSALAIFAQNNPTIFDGKIGVDSLWSISDRVPSPTPTATPTPAPIGKRR